MSAMDKIKAKVENVLHKDNNNTTTGTHGTTGTHATGTHTTGTHGAPMSGTHTTGTHAGTHNDPTGPHDSHAMNKADPRVDQTTGYGNTHSTGTGFGNTHSSGAGYGNTHSTGTTGYGGTTSGSDPTGPHDSKMANKLDPRVDATQPGPLGNSGAARHGTGVPTGAGGLTGTGHQSSGLTGTGHQTYGSDPTGPHSSHLGNQADPRVDSSHVGGYGNSGMGSTGHSGIGSTGHSGVGTTGLGSTGHSGMGTTGHSSGLTGSGHQGGLTGTGHNTYGSDPSGPHDSRLGNQADPRIDSSHAGNYGNTGHSGAGTHAGIGGGPGPAENTAGPHKSDMLNKIDPRVDSNLDGSKTYGGNKTSGV